MRTITMRPAPAGCWYACHGRKRLALIVQPVYAANLGLRPTPADVISAVKEIAPSFGATAETPIRWAERA